MKICDLAGVPPVCGSVFGIELELEWRGPVPFDYTESATWPEGWNVPKEGSLRNGAELTYGPAPYAEICEAITKLYALPCMDAAGLMPSPRTSTHVHINVADLAPQQAGFACWFFGLVEDSLIKHFASSRMLNNFCYPLAKSHGASKVISTLLSGSLGGMDQRRKYLALNYNTITSLGTIELRIFEASHTAKDAISALSVAEVFRSIAEAAPVEDAMDIVTDLSQRFIDCPEDFHTLTSKYFPTLKCDVPFHFLSNFEGL